MISASLVLVFHAAVLASCGGGSSSSDSPSSPSAPGASAAAIDAEGWENIHMLSTNFTDTHLDNIGHYHTERNACLQDAWGALELNEWNEIVTAANRAASAPPLREGNEHCVDEPVTQNYRYMNGRVVMDLSNGTKRELFSQRGGGKICSTISDTRASDALLSALHKLVATADKKDCDIARP